MEIIETAAVDLHTNKVQAITRKDCIKIFTVKKDNFDNVVKQFAMIANNPEHHLVIIGEKMPMVLPLKISTNRFVASFNPTFTGIYAAMDKFLNTILNRINMRCW